MPGSNRRPPRCKRGALPAELTPHAGAQCRGSSEAWLPRRPRSCRARSPALNVCGSASRLRPPCSSRRIRASSASRSPAGGPPSPRALVRGPRARPPARPARHCAARAQRACARTPARRFAARRASPRSVRAHPKPRGWAPREARVRRPAARARSRAHRARSPASSVSARARTVRSRARQERSHAR